MNKFILIGVATGMLATAHAQDAASTPVASPDVENLRQQVQALTETVKTLQQQVKDQQAAIEKANSAGEQAPPQNGGTPSVASTSSEGRDGARPSNSPASSAPAHFATEDASVVSSTATTPAASPGPGVNANGTAVSGNFPTSDTSVVSSTPETISSTGAGASLT